MSSRLVSLILPLLLAAACGDDGRAGEIACQQRLVEHADRAVLSVAGAQSFERMPLAGCTEDQRLAVQLTARAARRLALTFARLRGGAAAESREDAIRALQRQLEQVPRLQDNQLFLDLQLQLEQYEMRRRIMREDLERMRREAGLG